VLIRVPPENANQQFDEAVQRTVPYLCGNFRPDKAIGAILGACRGKNSQWKVEQLVESALVLDCILFFFFFVFVCVLFFVLVRYQGAVGMKPRRQAISAIAPARDTRRPAAVAPRSERMVLTHPQLAAAYRTLFQIH
jgi:hypothetical protein